MDRGGRGSKKRGRSGVGQEGTQQQAKRKLEAKAFRFVALFKKSHGVQDVG